MKLYNSLKSNKQVKLLDCNAWQFEELQREQQNPVRTCPNAKRARERKRGNYKQLNRCITTINRQRESVQKLTPYRCKKNTKKNKNKRKETHTQLYAQRVLSAHSVTSSSDNVPNLRAVTLRRQHVMTEKYRHMYIQ